MHRLPFRRLFDREIETLVGCSIPLHADINKASIQILHFWAILKCR